MKLDAKMLNLLGVLVLVAVLGLGLSQVALPVYQGVQTAQGEIESQRQSNQALSMQFSALEEAESRQGEIEDDVAQMREQLPDTPDSYSALRVIEAAVAKHGVKIDAHTIGEPVPFTPQGGVGGEGEAAAPPAEASEEATDDGAEPAPGAATDAAAEVAPGAEAAATDPKQQVTITLEISVPDEPTATAVIDSLREGPRLLLPITASFARGDSSQTDFDDKLTVTLLAFSYEEPV